MNKQDRMRKRKRAWRVRKKIRAVSNRPRLCVNKTNRHLHVQIIDDANGVTLVSTSTFAKENKMKKTKENARLLGQQIAKKAIEKKIGKVVFDRGSGQYQGKGIFFSFAEGAREAGLQF